jgi:small subunit ribosomal protein S4
MGDIKKLTNKYSTPSHPWRKERIDTERALRRQYGLKNSTELWKLSSKLKSFKDQIKNFATMAPEQGAKEKAQLEARLAKYGIQPESGNLEEVLDYTPQTLLNRRLQTVLVQRNMARTMRQARQFIVHRHVLVGDKCISAPGYLVTVAEETQITFKANSDLANEQHPERLSKEDAAKKRAEEKEAKRKLAEKVEEAEVVELTEEDQVE